MMIRAKKSKLIISAVVMLAVISTGLFVSMPGVNSRTKPYYSGDAIVYKNQVIVASTNMGALEFFSLNDGKLTRESIVKDINPQNSVVNDFYNLDFSQEDGRLYAYAVDGRYLYKYDVSNVAQPVQIKKIKDNSYDYFLGVKKVGSRLYTIGTKGVKLWNGDFQVIDSFKIYTSHPNNLVFDDEGRFIYNTTEKGLEVFDTKERKNVVKASLDIKENHDRKSFYQVNDGRIFLVDDNSLKEFNYGGKLLHEYKHGSSLGYYVDGRADQNHLYFSSGNKVVKFSKDDLNIIKTIQTQNMGALGGWAVGLRVIGDSLNEKVVVFNTSGILVLDKNLSLLGSFKATEENLKPIESLSLNLDKTTAAANSQVSVRGNGFGLNEELLIEFAGNKTTARTDQNGRFTQIVTVPVVSPNNTNTDIKVTGKVSKLTYSIGFKVQ